MTTLVHDAPPLAPIHADLARGSTRAGVRVTAHRVTRTLRNGTSTLSDVTLAIEPGQLVAVIGASGAGKTTLLEALAGLRRASSGEVRLDGRDVRQHRDALRSSIGYVPQDDIIHRDLPVRSTLRHAARLRLPGQTADEQAAIVDDVMDRLGLTERATTVVGRLSGGQRKRVSIAVELLTRPRALFLDEPTSGLDPGTARQLLATLRGLASAGSTVVLTTHSPDDVSRCDQVIVLARGGRLVFQGSPSAAVEHLGVDDLADAYAALDRLAEAPVAPPAPLAPRRPQEPIAAPGPVAAASPPERSTPPPARFAQQHAALWRRNVEVLARNRLTLAIMLGAPVLVVAMFVVLFRPDAFDPRAGDPLTAVAITSWLAFAAFFFGLTYGLLQVCTELPVVRRERHVGLLLGAYVVAKITVLLPVLAVVNAAMVLALQATDRLPSLGWTDLVALVGVLVLAAGAALTMGLLASAAVSDPSQATLALPLLCFPAVLFGGAVLPVPAMAAVGRAISAVTTDRWTFEALGRVLSLESRFAAGTDPGLVSSDHGDAFTGAVTLPVTVLAVFAVTSAVAAVCVLQRRTAVR